MNLEQSGDLGSGFLAGSQHGDNFWFCRKVFERPTRISNCESAKWLASSIAAPDVIGYCPSIDLCGRTFQSGGKMIDLDALVAGWSWGDGIFGGSGLEPLLHELGTVAYNITSTSLNPNAKIVITTRPTPIQAKAFKLLDVNHACSQ